MVFWTPYEGCDSDDDFEDEVQNGVNDTGDYHDMCGDSCLKMEMITITTMTMETAWMS